jgi:hypothetical protein
MTVTTTAPTGLEPCVSLTSGTLSPDERVNYAYGMVLGLDEFLQEQLHNLSKDYLHERALHGYGTVSGLHVAITPVTGAQDFQVSVATGIAVDQWGREIVITCDQCAWLGAWLAAQELAGHTIPPDNVDESGVVTLYVTAAYAECLDDMVPLPGQPCSSSDQTMVPSRIRDAWDVELSFDRPAMPRWDTDRRLARLLATVVVVPGLPEASSDESKIADAVRALGSLSPDGPDGVPGLDPAPGTTFQLPAETAAAALDRILAMWVTEVRPGLKASTDTGAGPAPDLITPTTDPRILLSTLHFTPASPFDPAAPAITQCDDPDDDGRPYLLHTELIQELRFLGGDAAPAAPPKPAVELATMAGVAVAQEPTTLDLWFHLDDAVQLPQTVNLSDEDGNNADFTTAAVDPDAAGFSRVWTLTAPDQGVMDRDGLQVSALLPATKVFVKDLTQTLADVVPDVPPLLDSTGSGDVLVYGEVRAVAPAVVLPPAPRPPSEFATFTFLARENEAFVFEAWFHPEPYGEKPDVGLEKLPVAKIFDDITGDELEIAWQQRNGGTPNVFLLRVSAPKFKPDVGVLWLRHLYLTDEFAVVTPDATMTMTEWITKAGIDYVGWEPERPDVVAFSRAQLVTVGNVLTHGEIVHDQPVQPLFAPVVPVKKAVAKKAVAKKAATKKAVARKAATKKAAGQTPAKRAPAKKAPAKRTGRAPR